MNTETYLSPDARWRWRVVDDSGESIGESASSFGSHEECLDNYRQVASGDKYPVVVAVLLFWFGAIVGAGVVMVASSFT